MHGEYFKKTLPRLTGGGTPPYAWGILGVPMSQINTVRYTPICMGNTLKAWGFQYKTSVHPHMHGEYV